MDKMVKEIKAKGEVCKMQSSKKGMVLLPLVTGMVIVYKIVGGCLSNKHGMV